jgi:asparagine synthase (glutamine-hydrolysing)
MSEPADVAVFRLAEVASGHVRVVLSGEGGDELFGGYPKYRYAGLAHRLGSVPAGVRGVVLGAIERRLGTRHARARVAFRAAAAPDQAERLQTWFAPFTASERLQLLGDFPAGPLRGPVDVHGADPIDTMLRHDLRGWLPDNLLERGDRMSMAASVELRPPFLDHHLAELACRLPSSVKVRRGVTKWVLKEAAKRHLPAGVVDRPKIGFRVPLDRWFRAELRDMAWDRLTGTESWVGQTLDRVAVRALLERHQSGAANEEARLWTLLCLEVWHDCLARSAQTAGTSPLSGSAPPVVIRTAPVRAR